MVRQMISLSWNADILRLPQKLHIITLGNPSTKIWTFQISSSAEFPPIERGKNMKDFKQLCVLNGLKQLSFRAFINMELVALANLIDVMISLAPLSNLHADKLIASWAAGQDDLNDHATVPIVCSYVSGVFTDKGALTMARRLSQFILDPHLKEPPYQSKVPNTHIDLSSQHFRATQRLLSNFLESSISGSCYLSNGHKK